MSSDAGDRWMLEAVTLLSTELPSGDHLDMILHFKFNSLIYSSIVLFYSLCSLSVFIM